MIPVQITYFELKIGTILVKIGNLNNFGKDGDEDLQFTYGGGGFPNYSTLFTIVNISNEPGFKSLIEYEWGRPL